MTLTVDRQLIARVGRNLSAAKLCALSHFQHPMNLCSTGSSIHLLKYWPKCTIGRHVRRNF